LILHEELVRQTLHHVKTLQPTPKTNGCFLIHDVVEDLVW